MESSNIVIGSGHDPQLQQTGTKICYEDDHLAIVWKPPGILTISDTGRGEPSVSSALPTLFPAAALAEKEDVAEGSLADVKKTLTEAAKALWLAKPGVGMQEMLSMLHARYPQNTKVLGSRTAVKQLVRLAVASIPYRRAPDALGAQPGFTKASMVETLVAQRQAHRIVREWSKADKLREGLEGIGIIIDDKLKTWTLGPLPEVPALLSASPTPLPTDPGRTNKDMRCSMCGELFSSRNQLFKHLRNAATSCGLTVAAAGGIASDGRHNEVLPKLASTVAKGTTAARLVLGPLVLPKWAAGLVLVTKTAVGYNHAQKQLCESRVRLNWQAVVHGYFPQQVACARVLQRSRGTHVQGGHVTLVEMSVFVKSDAIDGDQPFLRVLRALNSLGHPVVGEHRGKNRTLVSVAASGTGTAQADDGRGAHGRSVILLALVGFHLSRVPDVARAPANFIEVRHQPPSRFASFIEREQIQWVKREREILHLRQAVTKASLTLPESVAADHASRPFPPAYEVGAAVFCGLTFQLGQTQAVMIPRLSTEVLVRAAAVEINTQLHKADPKQEGLSSGSTKRVLDLGCGCGNVLLSIMHYCRATGLQLLGVGMDLSSDARELAEVNAATILNADGQQTVKFLTGDFGRLHEMEALHELGPFDLVVCNPPYLDHALQEGLAAAAPELLAEPPAALFAAEHGTAAYKAIVTSLAACKPPILLPNAVVLFELGKGRCQSVVPAVINGLGIPGCHCAVIQPPDTLREAAYQSNLGVGPTSREGTGYVLEVCGIGGGRGPATDDKVLFNEDI